MSEDVDRRDRHAAFAVMSDVVLAVAAEREPGPVLQRLVDAARELVGARYAALGTPDGHGGFSRFLTSGMSDELVRRIGPLPRVHGLLGAMLDEHEPYRTDDITTDPRFEWWPEAHPRMGSFLGVPIIAQGEVIGAFYLTDKEDAPRFSDDDRELIQLLAAHAAVAISNARLWERSRELVLTEERTQMARELHDAMTQTLFSLRLTAETAAEVVLDDPDAAREHLRTVGDLAAEVLRELRALIAELRPADLAADGLVPTLRKHVDLLQRAHGRPIRFTAESEPNLPVEHARELFRIAQEALHNALRHAGAASIEVTVAVDGDRVRVSVADDGVGFDPQDRLVKATRLGLVSMRERARSAGGALTVDSTPGRGTTVTVEVGDG